MTTQYNCDEQAKDPDLGDFGWFSWYTETLPQVAQAFHVTSGVQNLSFRTKAALGTMDELNKVILNPEYKNHTAILNIAETNPALGGIPSSYGRCGMTKELRECILAYLISPSTQFLSLTGGSVSSHQHQVQYHAEGNTTGMASRHETCTNFRWYHHHRPHH